MVDLNEKYVFESDKDEGLAFEDRKIKRSYDKPTIDNAFSVNQLKEKKGRIEQGKIDYIAERDAEIATVQAKIDEATAALKVV